MFLDGSVDFRGHRPCKEHCNCVGKESDEDETNKKRKRIYEEDSDDSELYSPRGSSRKRRLHRQSSEED